MSFRSRQGQDPTHPRTGTLLRTTPVEQLSARGSRARVVTNACTSLLAGSCPAAFEIVGKRRKFAPSFAPAVAARPRSRCNRGRCGRRAGHSLIPRCSTCTVTHLTRHSSRQPGSPFQFCKRQARPGHLHYPSRDGRCAEYAALKGAQSHLVGRRTGRSRDCQQPLALMQRSSRRASPRCSAKAGNASVGPRQRNSSTSWKRSASILSVARFLKRSASSRRS